MNQLSAVSRLALLAALGFACSCAFFWLQLKPGLGPDTSIGLLAWWAALCGLSIFNFGAWVLTGPRRNAATYPLQTALRSLSLVFVLGCAFRSFLPRADVQRLCLVDHWLSTVLVGRTVATVAELCFVAQWALILRKYADDLNSRTALVVSRLILPLIVVAECCSWYAVVTTAYIGNVIEQSIWVVTACMAAIGAISLWPRGTIVDRRVFAGAVVFATGFAMFMGTVDIPMYVSRWQADEAAGRLYLSLSEGLPDLASRRVLSYAWEHWREELAWMGLYFSVAVWGSIGMIHIPRLTALSSVSSQVNRSTSQQQRRSKAHGSA